MIWFGNSLKTSLMGFTFDDQLDEYEEEIIYRKNINMVDKWSAKEHL